jgi:Bacterial sugar transferase
MELLVLLAVGAASLVGAAFSKLLADEFKAWSPTLVSSIIAAAVSLLQPTQRDRATEEWTSHVNELPGDLSRVVFACGCILAALKIDGLPIRAGKRILDVSFASVSLIAMAPLLILVAISLKLTSWREPTLFRHPQIGLNGRKFVAYKFRTLPGGTVSGDDQPSEKSEDDPPSEIGKLIRRASFDELPQLFNVLNGDMTIVGPPPLPEDASGKESLNQKPGIFSSWKSFWNVLREHLRK